MRWADKRTRQHESTATSPQRHPAYDAIPQPQRIGNQLRDILALSHAFEAQLGATLGCNPTDLAAMEVLIDEGPQSPTDLAQRLDVSTAAATQIVDRLTALGHVSRTAHVNDRRRVVVVPAPASIEAAVTELMPIIQGVDAAIRELDDHDRAIVESFLDRVAATYAQSLRD